MEARDLEAISRDLEAVDQQILSFEQALKEAKLAKTKLEKEHKLVQLDLERRRQDEARREQERQAKQQGIERKKQEMEQAKRMVEQKQKEMQEALRAAQQLEQEIEQSEHSHSLPSSSEHNTGNLNKIAHGVSEDAKATELHRKIGELKRQINEVKATKSVKQNVTTANVAGAANAKAKRVVRRVKKTNPKMTTTTNESGPTHMQIVFEKDEETKEQQQTRNNDENTKPSSTPQSLPDSLKAAAKPAWANRKQLTEGSETPTDPEQGEKKKDEWTRPAWASPLPSPQRKTPKSPVKSRLKSTNNETNKEELRKKEDPLDAFVQSPRAVIKKPTSPARPGSPLRRPKPWTRDLPARKITPAENTIATPELSASEPKPEVQLPAESTSNAQGAAVASEPNDEVVQADLDELKKRHQWSKPNWALPSERLESNESIIKDSVNTANLKQAQAGGYVRQVKPKDNLEIVKGSFVKPAEKTDPRLVWIVVMVDDKKVGKIVMHLYGKDIDGLVDKFKDLKGYEITREKSQIVVDASDPKFYITTAAAKGVNGKKGVYGVVQEGHEVVEAIQAAATDACITIKQAHIYPVKRARGS